MPTDPLPSTSSRRYWRANLKVVSVLLIIWFIASILLSIVWADALNQFSLGGFPLGFWISQQGAIYVFVLLILAYAIIMSRLDRAYRRNPDRR
jgi:putative solute:sodium symporter small subunit